MPIEVRCPTCGAVLPAPDEFAGKKIRCADCQAIVDVPAAAGAPPLPVAPPPRDERDDRHAEPRPRRTDDDDDRPSRRPKRDWDDERPPSGQNPKVLAGGAIAWLLLLGLLAVAGLGLIGMALIPAKG